MVSIPRSTAPYKRTYKHTSQRGKESAIMCDICGRKVPRWKSFTVFRGFKIRDSTILKQIDRRLMHTFNRKMHVCPKCARFHHIVKVGKSVRKKHTSR